MNSSSQAPGPVTFIKIAMALTLVLFLLGGTLTMISYSQTIGRLQHQERLEAESLMTRGLHVLGSRQQDLSSLAERLAQSKDLPAALAARTELGSRMDVDQISLHQRTGSGLYSFIFLFDEQGHLLHENAGTVASVQELHNARATIQEMAQLAGPLGKRLAAEVPSSIAGFFLAGEVPVLLAASRVLPGAKQNSAGLLITGCYLDASFIRTIHAENGLTMRIGPAHHIQPPGVPQNIKEYFAGRGSIIFTTPVNLHTYAGYAQLADIFDSPSLILEIQHDRTAFQQGIAQWRQMIAAAGIAQGVLLILLLMLLHRLVFRRRLHQLVPDIDASIVSDHADSRAGRAGNGDFSILAQQLNAAQDSTGQGPTRHNRQVLYLAQVLNSIPCGVMVVDATSHTVVDMNTSAAAMIGFAPRDITGRLCHQFLCPAQGCPIPAVNEKISLNECVLLRADGTQVPVIQSVAAVEKDGRTMLIKSFFDISMRRQTEERLSQSESRFRCFFAENPAGCCIWTTEGVILACNPAFAQLLGYDTVAEVREAGILQHCQADGHKGEPLASVIRKKPGERLQCTLLRQDGTPVHCAANIYPHYDSDGAVTEWRGYFFDNTQRILLEQQKQQVREMGGPSALASGLAHDINNILVCVRGNADFVCSTAGPDMPAPTRRAMEDILRACERAQKMTSQVLDWSKPQEKPAQAVCLAAILDETLQMLSATLPADVHLDVHIHSQGTVLAGENELHQIVMNLCVNAIQAMASQGGTLRIVLDEVDQSQAVHPVPDDRSTGHVLRLRIEDTGCGMAPELKEHIFDPFFTTKTREAGNGLGLWLVKNHITAMHGQITLQSEPGQGTVFILTFPLYHAPLSSPVLESADWPSGHKQIALVDGNPFTLEVCTSMLQQLGCSVHAFSQATAALAGLSSGTTPASLLIINDMPDMDGCSLVRQLRQRGCPVPVLLCLEKESSVDPQAAGISGIIHKPVSMEQLAAGIRLALDHSPTADHAWSIRDARRQDESTF